MTYRTFVKSFLVYSFLTFLLIAGWNFFIDPFDFHASTLIKGINHVKLDTAGRLATALRVIQLKPKTVVLGTSRVKAFTSENLPKQIDIESFYNLGVSGANFDEMYSYFLHALFNQPDLKTVLVGIDLFSFNEKRKPQKDFSSERLQKSSFLLEDLKNLLFSYKAFSASCQSFFKSFFKYSSENEILQMGEDTYLQFMLSSEENYKNYKIDQKKIEKFEKMVEMCKEKSIKLKVFVCPVKAMYWEFYYQNGLWPYVENLKRQLSAIYPIWDFSGYNALTTETLDSGGNLLYIECSHCTPYAGSLLLKRMFQEPTKIDAIGYLLKPETIDSCLIKILEERFLWLLEYQDKQEKQAAQKITG